MRLLALLLLTLPLAPTALAQLADPAPVYAKHLGPQLATLLADPVQRSAALDLALLVAQTQPSVDLTATVDPLVDVYETDTDMRHRRAAAVALALIGDPTGMQRLAELSRYETDEHLRQTTVHLLVAYAEALPRHEAASLGFVVGTAE